MDFRCFTSLDLEASEHGAILTGDNAQGKTSILEAVCMLVRLHSPRTHRLPSLARHGCSSFGIAGNPWESERQVRWTKEGLALKADGESLNGKSPYLQEGGLIVWMGNEDLNLIRGPGEGRRRYLDFIGVQIDPTYRRAWSRYSRALRAKNILLKEQKPNDAEIRSYEELLIEHGTALTETRARMVADLSPLVAEAQSHISGTNESLSLQYVPASGPDLRQSILQARDRELRLRQSVVGPHRDDLTLRIQGMPAADFASEGQQRTIALALKLAQGKLLESLGRKLPIYLLDDIFGELDPDRRNALMHHLPPHAQKWVTTTHLDWLRDSSDFHGMTHYHVHKGACSRA
jgi:DNA replication and repair protein RecF